jgi:integrative and conjugative element protein (TIGR02256 family)
MKFQVLITQKAYSQIQEEVNQHPHEETGGVMIGFQTPFAVVITDATGPGPSAVHSPNAIQFDDKYCERKVRWLASRGKPNRYVGDWHSHPFSKLKPSKMDQYSFSVKSLTQYQITNPLMIITSSAPLVSIESFIYAGKLKKVTPQLIDHATMLDMKKQALIP